MRRLDPLLVGAVVLQWIVTAGVALVADHAGSVYGDRAAVEAAVEAADMVAGGTVPATAGPGYPLLLAPLVALTDSVGSVASVVTTINVALLAPLAAASLVAIARRAAGPVYAVAAAVVWSLAPVAAIPLFVPRYRDTYVNDVLPALYGLTVRPEFAAMALSVAAAALGMRAVEGAARAGLLAGLFAGAACAVSPPAGGVAAGIVLALVVAGRRRALLEAAVGLVAALLPALLWRSQAPGVPTVALGNPSWASFQATMAQIREYFWSNRLLQWLPIAGAIGALRFAPPLSALLAGWLGFATVTIVATSPGLEGGRLFVAMIPAWPAYALLVAAIPALVPTLVARLGPRLTPRTCGGDVGGVAVVATLVLLAALPLAIVALVAL